MALTFKYNMNGSDIYYLTSGKEFEAFCTSIYDHKNEFDNSGERIKHIKEHLH